MSSTMQVDTYQSIAETIPDEALLGSILWFSIREADINFEETRQRLTDLGLSLETLRERIHPVDAFKKAMRDSEIKLPREEKSGIRTAYLVRDVGAGKVAEYHVVREETVREAGRSRRLSYTTIIKGIFTYGIFNDENEYEGHSITIVPTADVDDLPDDEREWVEEQLTAIPERYGHYCTHLDSHAVRRYVVRYITDLLHGTKVRTSGGIYFVRQSHAEVVRKLSNWVKSIGSEFHSLPLLDLEEQRDFLMEAFQDETVMEVQRLMTEISDILGDPARSIRQATYDSYLDRAAESLAKTREYQEVLDRDLKVARNQAVLFRRQVAKLAERVK